MRAGTLCVFRPCDGESVGNEAAGLPAGLRHPGDQTTGSKFTEGDTGKFEAGQVTTATAGHQAAVGQARGGRITGQHGQTDVVFFFLELCPEGSILRDGGSFAFLTLDPAGFSHGSVIRGKNWAGQIRDAKRVARGFFKGRKAASPDDGA